MSGEAMPKEYGYFRQEKHRMPVFDLNAMTGLILPYIHLYPLCDSHDEDIYADSEALDHYVEWIRRDPYGFAVGAGDLLDAVNKHSKGDMEDRKKPVKQALKDQINRLRPIAHKILIMTGGNHDKDRPKKEIGIDLAEQIADALGVLYEPEWAGVRLKLGAHNNGGAFNYDVMVAHGTGGGRTTGAKANMIERMAQILIADLYVCGHTHQQLTHPKGIYRPKEHKEFKGKDGGSYIMADLVPMQFMMGGTFRRSGGYSARALYPPNLIGQPRARLDGSIKWIKIES